MDSKKANIYADDAELWSNMPVAIQIVARPFDDEELLATTKVIDKVIN